MKTHFIFSGLFAVSSIFGVSSTEDKNSLFEKYLSACALQDRKCQPVHLRSASQEKSVSFHDMTILDLDVSKIIQIEEVAKRALYGEADVVHLANLSTQRASRLYEMLEDAYSHFIHVPGLENGLLIASKYPLSQAMITCDEAKDMLEFSVQGADNYTAHVCSNELSTYMDGENNIVTPIHFSDASGTLTLVKQEFSPFQVEQKVNRLASNMFEILPIRHERDRNSDDKAGYSTQTEVHYSWGGENGGRWGGSIKAEAHDGRGNYVEGEVRQNDRGEGSVSARAGHEKN